jgi:hypothetical protein
MEHRSKADLSILARDPFGKANFGVLARHAAPEPAVNAPLLAKKEAIPPMMRARDRYGVDETAQRLSRLEADARLLKNINYENVKRITVDTDHYAPTVRRSQLQNAVKPFPTSSVAQDELFAKKIAALEALSVKDGVWDDQPRYGLHDPPPESFRETFDHAKQDVGQSQNNTNGSNQVTLRGNVQRNLGSKGRHASQRTSDGSPEARASFTVKKHADGVPYLARRDAEKTALENAAAIMNSKAPQAPAESDECGMYITHTISEDRTGTADEVMAKRLAALSGNRHQTNKASKLKPLRKNAWGEVESGSTGDEIQLSTNAKDKEANYTTERPRVGHEWTDSLYVSKKRLLEHDEIMEEANRFQLYYKKYKELRERLERVPEKEQDEKEMVRLLAMHKRLTEMKSDIWDKHHSADPLPAH